MPEITIDYSKIPKELAIPEASSMIESFRAVGYSFETAIADIIDNSISADAENIWINFEWKGSDTWLSIKDDGYGMDNKEVIDAMRPGCKNPLDDRSEKDLGRFGLGLKTSSFSQCRKLTVISKKTTCELSFWTWDLDYVKLSGKWELLNYIPGENSKVSLDSASGTIVLWNDIDRLVKDFKSDDQKALDKFLYTMEYAKKHIAMVFHRFIENHSLKLWFQGRLLEAWNPFMINESATQSFPEEPLYNGNVTMKGYVLPHKSKLSDEKFKKAEGTKGWNGHQGFYIYRIQRLLLAGDWIGLFRKEEHFKLARISIDLPNSLDSDWQIDIKKSVARPPLVLKDQLKAYASRVRAQAVEVYRHKGKNVKQLPGQKFVPLWIDHKRGDKWFYKINREHPIVLKLKSQLTTEAFTSMEMLIRFIEETVPSKSIYIKEASDEDNMGNPFEGIDQEPIRKAMIQIYENLTGEGKTDMQAKAIVLNIEPFNQFPHFLEFIK